MKNLTKKLLVVLVTVLMLIPSVTVHAAANRNQDHTTLEITGLDGGETVDLYQLVKANYNPTGTNVDSYSLVSRLTDADKYVVLREAVYYAAGDPEVEAGTKSVNDIKTPEVRVKVADLPVDDNGVIKADTITGKDSDNNDYSIAFNPASVTIYNSENEEKTANQDISNKLPFSPSAPTEKQISAIAADIAANPTSWASAKKAIDGTATATASTAGTGSNKNGKWTVNAYAAATSSDYTGSTTYTQPAIVDATGIYLGKINPTTGSDTIYNPVIVSVGYKDVNNNITYTGNGVDAYKTYASPSVAAKRSNPDVDKTVTGGKTDNFACPVVATDLNGNPLFYTGKATTHNGTDIVSGYVPNADTTQAGAENIDPDKLVYVKTGNTQANVDIALAKTDATEKATALAACTTKSVEDALYGTDADRHSGALGTKFTYSVQPTLPSYPENAVNKTLWFQDEMSTGLDYVDGSLDVSLQHAVVEKTYNPETKEYVFTVKYVETTFAEGVYEEDGQGGYVFTTDTEAVSGKTYYKYVNTKLADAIDDPQGYRINYVYDAIPVEDRTKGGLVMTYQAVINKDAFKGVKGNPNVITMKYAVNTDEGSTWKELTRPTDKGNRERYDEEVVYTYEIYFKKDDGNNTMLKDAVFGLYANQTISYDDTTTVYRQGDLICTVQTNNAGIGYTTEVMPGKYYIQEIDPPKGYQLNSKKYEFEVKASDATKEIVKKTHSSWEYTSVIEEAIDFNENTTPKAKLEGYLVGGTANENGHFYNIDDYPASTWTYTEGENGAKGTLSNGSQIIYEVLPAYISKENHVRTESLEELKHENDPTINRGWIYVNQIPNTKTPELPSTGGIGTYLFTIAGVAIIATAAFMLIFRKKEEHNH